MGKAMQMGGGKDGGGGGAGAGGNSDKGERKAKNSGDVGRVAVWGKELGHV